MIATQPSPVANATAKPARRPRLGLLRWMRLVGGLAQPAGRGRSVVQGGSSPKLLTENQVLGKHIHARPEPANDDLSHLRRLPGSWGPWERSPRPTRAPTKSSASSYPRPVQRLAAHRPCQIRDRCSGDRRGTAGSHGDTDRHCSTNAPTCHRGQEQFLLVWRVIPSRIRTLEGISRWIYRRS